MHEYNLIVLFATNALKENEGRHPRRAYDSRREEGIMCVHYVLH